MGKADLHMHRRYGDGMATVPEVLRHVEARGDLDVIAITEHDTLRAADEARELHARVTGGQRNNRAAGTAGVTRPALP